MTEKRKAKKRHRRWPAVLLVIVILILLAGCGAGLWYLSELKPTGSADEEVTVVVEDGESYDSLLKKLESDGLIRSELAAKIYTRLNGSLDHYAGTFVLNKGMSTEQILDYLANSDNSVQTYNVITVPEGTWAKQIAAILAENYPEYTADDFIHLWNDSDYITTLAQTYSFLNPETLNNEQFFVKLEGYLFPETYYMDKDLTTDEITRTFLNQFQTIYDKYKNQIEASGMSLEEVLTLASIVQFESGDPAVMPDIARVFLNRLDQDMPLQSSVTVCYALYDKYSSAQDCETNPDVESPYNTYLHNGLPIGPILNPGEDAIKAVLEPADNDYLYFVADIHGDGSVHFARTWEEHEANVEKYNLNLTE